MKKAFPKLYGQASTGKVKTWEIWVEGLKDGTAIIYTQHGYEDGEQQTATVKVTEGKNLGNARETTPFEQACSEAESKWNKKRDKKYFPLRSDALKKDKGVLLPMLAQDYKKRGHDITWPAYVQPKLNGIRCLARKVDGRTIHYTSRGGKDFTTLEHMTPHLLQIMQSGDVLDGELFTKSLTFQEIVAAVKREKTVNEDIVKVQYWVYDCVQEEEVFDGRFKYLSRILEKAGPIVPVPTKLAKDEDQMKKLHAQMMEAGYEGTIIRNMHGTYRCNYRSADLQKYKDFIDEEFTIVGGKEGVGKDEGAVTFICETEEGKRFDCRPRGTYEQRQGWWKRLRKLEGLQLTVRYQNLSDDGIPIFPVGINIRDYE
jgi:DNA ligase-1